MKKITAMLLLGIQLNFSQTGAMGYNNYYRSVPSFALGEQGVASINGIDGLVYNPANLIHTKGIQFSFYQNPYYYLGFDGLRMKSYSVVTRHSDNIYWGAEFMSWDFYSLVATEDNPSGTGHTEHSFNRTFALSFAQTLSTEFGYGVQLRYSKDRFGSNGIDHLFGSAGLHYSPESFQNKLRLGFSLMNLSTPISIEGKDFTGIPITYYDAPSSYLRLGFEYDFASDELFKTTIHTELSKEIAKYIGKKGQSSFESLFNDWHDAPRDITLHSGLSFIMNPIPLGKNFTFLQELYAGYLHDGPLAGQRTMFYNGFNIGVGINGVEFVAGYAGLWHIVNNDAYGFFLNPMPWETFQFSIRNALWGIEPDDDHYSDNLLTKIILTAGIGYTNHTGRFAEQKIIGPNSQYVNISSPDGLSYSIESAFYFSEQSALVANFRYARLPMEYKYYVLFFDTPPYSMIALKLRLETLTLTSAYRYHPLQDFTPFFFELGFGVQRQNPLEETSPKYKYNTIALLNTGFTIPLNRIVLTPKINFTSLIDRIYGSAPRLGGFNQVEFSINFGYLFE